MSNESEKNPARRVEDKRADGAVDWSDAPRFTALGIAETWCVTVEAEGRRVVSISEQHCAGLDESDLAQFHATVRSCAMHLLAFVGAPPMSRTAGAAKGGNTSEERRSVSAAEKPTGDLTDEQIERVWIELPLTGAYNMGEARLKFARAIERAAIAAHLAQLPRAERPATGLESENELISMARMKQIRAAIRQQDGMDGDDWDFALANAVAANFARQSQQAEPMAWMHEDGRVITAATMAGARKDGGAMLSSLRGYTIPLYAAPTSQEGAHAARNAVLEEAANMCEGQRGLSDDDWLIVKGCAMAIRSLKTPASAERSGEA